MRSNKLARFIFSFQTAAFVLLGLTIFLFFKVYFTPPNIGQCGALSNYKVFQSAHYHLLGDHDLYAEHPAEHCYTYKYSPSFALLFGGFAQLPNWVGVLLWCLISYIVTVVAIKSIPGFTNNNKAGLIYFIFFEYWVSVQSLQTNVLIVGLLIIAWTRLEKRHYLLATLLIVGTGFIKIFGLGAFALFLFYPKKFRLIFYSIMWGMILFFLPLIVMPWTELLGVYDKWLLQISKDYDFAGMSVYSMVFTTTGIVVPKIWVLVISLLIMLVSFLQVGKWNHSRFKLLCLAGLFIWVVCFNHKSESSTYIIVMVGIGLWYFCRKRKWFDHVLIILVFFVLSVCFSDLVPRFVKNDIGFKYHLKALPAFIMWIRIIVELWADKFKEHESTETTLPSVQ